MYNHKIFFQIFDHVIKYFLENDGLKNEGVIRLVWDSRVIGIIFKNHNNASLVEVIHIPTHLQVTWVC